MEHAITINSTPAALSINFEDLREAIEQDVAKYDVIVTADGVADAKKTASELNAKAKEIDTKRKAAIAEVSAPIKTADEQMKDLVEIYRNGRQKILDQIEKFEDETRRDVDKKLSDLRDDLWQGNNIEPEFRNAEYSDQVKISALTKTGNLTAAAKREVESRVRADKALQDQTERRCMDLENRSFRAGLKEPLTRDHVAHFLLADADEYEAGIDRILNAEVQRQERIETAERERQKRQDERAARTEPEPTPATAPAPGPAPATQQAAPEPPAPAPTGKIAWSVRCTFRLEVSDHISGDQIERELRRVLEQKAGITTLDSVQATPQAERE